jgi:hypothetical protein
MHPLSIYELLSVWENGYTEPPYRRAILLLSAACPEESEEQLANLSIGRRDARLLTLREWTFGSKLNCVTDCPACGERLEFAMNADDIRVSDIKKQSDSHSLALDGYYIDYRLLTTADIEEASSYADKERMDTTLIQRCIINARINGEEIPAGELPQDVINTLIGHMAENDPQAETRLLLTCPACNHRWNVHFDVVSFFWSEIQTWAARTMKEVHMIASTYGWSEADILAMSPLRRRIYLGMVVS